MSLPNRSGTAYAAPTDADRRPVMLGVSTADGITPVAVEVNPSTGGVVVDTQGGGLPSTFSYGQTTVVVTNTAVQLASHTLVNGVIIQALSANVNNIVVGDSSVTTSNGFQLQPGQATSIAVSNTNAIYINGTAADGICFIGS